MKKVVDPRFVFSRKPVNATYGEVRGAADDYAHVMSTKRSKLAFTSENFSFISRKKSRYMSLC